MTWDQFLSWSEWVTDPHGGVHFVLALTNLLLGAALLMSPKGVALHRIFGTAWVFSMLTVNTTALTLYGISGRMTLFHYFAILNLVALVPGYIAIRLYQATRKATWFNIHREMMVWAYFGLVAAGAWQAALKVIIPTLGTGSYRLAFNSLTALTFIAGIVVFFLLRRGRMTSSPVMASPEPASRREPASSP